VDFLATKIGERYAVILASDDIPVKILQCCRSTKPFECTNLGLSGTVYDKGSENIATSGFLMKYIFDDFMTVKVAAATS
jgi:hypothetical protein